MSYPHHRVNDILRRMEDNKLQPDTMKTCFGILAIMSREEPNKQIIAREGMEIILAIMISHLDKIDVQESGCDLLWSLAFNNIAIKDIIADNCGASVVVSALKRHSKSGDFLKSACGALSNMCQSKTNQEAVACQGGLRPLVDAISTHQANGKLLLFIFDALASVIVGNEDNARMVSSLGFIPLVIASIGQHKLAMDVVKSACHTLAILSDVKGQASSIAFAGGVPVILSLLDLHANYADLHRVAAVVLLRMLQESVHVGREIATQEGVRILLKSLEKGGAQHDTVAAVTHILFTITNPITSLTSIESQLWLPDHKSSNQDNNEGNSKFIASRFSSNIANIRNGNQNTDFARSAGRNLLVGYGPNLLSSTANKLIKSNNETNSVLDAHPHSSSSSLAGLVQVIGQYCERRDVVRASCRLLVNISHYSGVTNALEKLGILEKLLDCVSIHKETRDVVESTALLLKGIHRRNPPSDLSNKASLMGGLLTVFKSKIKDEEVAKACSDLLLKVLDNQPPVSSSNPDPRTLFLSTVSQTQQQRGSVTGASNLSGVTGTGVTSIAGKQVLTIAEYRNIEGKIWEYEAINLAVRALDHMCVGPNSTVPVKKPMSPPKKEAEVKSSRDKEKDQKEDSTSAPTAVSPKATPSGSVKAATSWSKHTPKSISSLLMLIELISVLPKMIAEISLYEEARQVLQSLLHIMPVKNSDLSRRIERLLSKIHSSTPNTAPARLPPPVEEPLPIPVAPPPLFPQLSTRTLTITSRPNSKEATAATAAAASAAGRAPTSGKAQGANGYTISRFFRVDESSFPKRLYPLHPQKCYTVNNGNAVNNGNGSNGNTNNTNQTMPRLLETWPNYLEKLCPSSSMSREFISSPSSLERMHLAYESTSAAGKGVMSRCPTPVPYDIPLEGAGEPFAHSLTFDSEFECGNLLRAVQRGDASYDLFLRSDLHTEGHTQWFYFAVSNTHPSGVVKLSEQGVQVPPVRVRFNIVNLNKPDSLFNSGMRPVVYSCVDASTRGIGWLRSGSDISYYSNSYQRHNTSGEGNSQYYTLSFTVEFQHAKDTVLIAYSYPYSVADYKAHIRDILHRPCAFDIIRSSRLCTTLGGENCDLLVITNFKDKAEKERIGPVTMSAMEAEAASWNSSTGKKMTARGTVNSKLKPALFFSGRVHPGETPASWMMKGMLEFLTGDSPQAQLLRQIFVIYIVPILNPDGVVYGNNRCALAGVDLNRQWKTPLKASHPTVFALKNFMAMMKKIRDINMYIDLHGHSRKYNVFMYGCDDKKKAKPLVRAFPKFFSSHSVGGKYVSYADCSFHIRKGRESTARVVVSRELNIPLSFTLEATFCGSNYGPYQSCHMNIGHMQEVGASLCDAVLQFSITENLIKDVLVVPPNLKLKKDKSEPEGNMKEKENNLSLIRGGSMRDMSTTGTGYALKIDRKEKKPSLPCPPTSHGGTSLFVGDPPVDGEKYSSNGNDGLTDSNKEIEVEIEGEGNEDKDEEEDGEGDDTGSEGGGGEDDNKDDSDSDFADTENEVKRSNSYDDTHGRKGVGSSLINANNCTNFDESSTIWRSTVQNENKFEKNSDDSQLFLPPKIKKDRKRPDLPPLGKTFIPVTSNITGNTNSSSCLNVQVLAPLIISGGSLSPVNVPSNGGRDSGALGTLIPPGTQGPGSAGRELGEEWTRRGSPVPSGADMVQKMKEECVITMSNKFSNSSLEGSVVNHSQYSSTKYNNLILSDDKKEKEKLAKDLKDLMVIDGIDKRMNLGGANSSSSTPHSSQSRRNNGNIVTGHSLIATNSTKEGNNDNNFHTNGMNIFGITTSSDEINKQIVNTTIVSTQNITSNINSNTNSNSNVSNINTMERCNPNNVFIDVSDTISGLKTDDLTGPTVPAGSGKSNIKSVRANRHSFSETSISSMVSLSVDSVVAEASQPTTRKNSFLAVAVKKKKKRK